MTLLQRFENLRPRLPEWMQDWMDIMIPVLQIMLIVLVAWLTYRLLQRLVKRVGDHYRLPLEYRLSLVTIVRWVLVGSSGMWVLERLGVSATVLWTAFTGFATVAAVAFFAAWSVLSNLFCAFLIFIVGPFRVGDYIELLDTAEKPGALGRVIDINLLYITLEESGAPRAGTLIQIPNALIFQRVLRRWRSGAPAPIEKKSISSPVNTVQPESATVP